MSEKIEIKITDASTEQLRTFALNVIGIPASNIPTNTGRDTLIAKIAAAHEKDTITVDVAAAPKATVSEKVSGAARVGLLDKSSGDDPKITIILHQKDEPGGKRDQFVSVNGSGMMIPRGKPVEIPYRFYTALCDAVKTTYVEDPNHDLVGTDTPAHPFQIVKAPSASAVNAWLKAQGALREAA